MRFRFSFVILLIFCYPGIAQEISKAVPGNELNFRIKKYIDSLKIFDTHEHLFDPNIIVKANLLDFSVLLQQNSFDDLVSAGMPDTMFTCLYSRNLSPIDKWRLVEPYWAKSFNTAANKILMTGIKDLYGISELNASTIGPLSEKMKTAYNTDWFKHVIKDICKIDFVIQDVDRPDIKNDYVRYVNRFSSWLSVRTKYSIDSLAVMQIEPIYTLEDYVKSMRSAVSDAHSKGMMAVKINIAYKRTLSFERTTVETARKVFRTLINGNEDKEMTFREAKPLQDYMLFTLLDLAKEFRMPVLFHTGLLAGSGNFIENSDPVLLTNLFREYPEVNFVLFHGSYPFGGELSVLAKTYRNVYIDLNWIYSISPSYSERYLAEWLETIPAAKIMAFGGDQRCVENTYGVLKITRQIIGNVLSSMVAREYFTEAEAKTIARMILHDNAAEFYRLH
jgi:uncharacterized protein